MFILLMLFCCSFIAAENKKLTQLIVLPRIVKLTAQGKLTEWPRPYVNPSMKPILRGFPVRPRIVEIE